MSEELLQTIPLQFGRYTYYRLGATTLDQLRVGGIIPKKNYAKLGIKKPDGLVVYHGAIKAVVEYKQSSQLASEKAIAKAISQELEVARALCKILIVTDGSKSFWINALNGERIRDVKGNELRTVFHPFLAKNTAAIEYLLDEVDASITTTESTIRSTRLIDPTPLASRLWQTIWVATGKSPIKCLYNVVELFIFKFLSDLRVLGEDVAFSRIYDKAQADPEDALDFYAKNTRSKIQKLFPSGSDGTTIINGTIFVGEDGAANLSQSILFARSLGHLQKYTEEFGSLTRIDKQFKTKLYESFLLQEVEALGQYFTPRKVVQSVIRMAGMDSPSFQFSNKRICDPFCGVGGFLLELLNMNENMRLKYTPDAGGDIDPPFVLNGFDKGFERDDERTIILAKANMLIYLAELLFASPKCSKEFARVFNDTFLLFKDNLGTFGHIIKQEDKKYDVILSNPPYVTSGSSIIKEEIRKTVRTTTEYPVNAFGLEGLSLEWIVKSLKKGGRAFVIIPDGILGRVGDRKLRDYILRECYLDAIVSLPVRTFFANWEHTYILAITKKQDPDDAQTNPVFTYLVSNIGERLTSVKREEIPDDDLPEMEKFFQVFMPTRAATKDLIEKQAPRCKIQPIKRFQAESHWVIDRWWTREELVAAGITESAGVATKAEIDAAVVHLSEAIADYEASASLGKLPTVKSKSVELGDTSKFNLFIGKRVLTKDTSTDATKIPVYSANVVEPMGYIEKSNIAEFVNPVILWGIDGNFAFNIIPAGTEFATTDHCGVIEILDSSILPEYLLQALYLRRAEESFDRGFRASLSNMRKFSVIFPVIAGGSFDAKAQKVAAGRFTALQEKRATMANAKARLDALFERYAIQA